MNVAPSLFVSHGSPMFALLPGELGPQLGELGRRLSDIRAVLVVSPHWQTRGVRVMTTPTPETIHDFSGFPLELYDLQYPTKGAPELARDAARLLAQAGFDVTLEAERGLDHGAWVPLRHLFPDGAIPVFQVSMPFDMDTAAALRLGAALAPLRSRGVLVAASGSLTHNLREYGQQVEDPGYVQQFADWVAAAVLANDTQSLLGYRHLAPHARRAHPSEEHYLPLLVAAGAALEGDVAQRIRGGIADVVLSMDSYAWGLD